MFSKPIKQVQTLVKKIHFHWNDNLDCVLIKLLGKTYSNAPLECIVQLFNSSCNTNVNKSQVHDHIQYMRRKKNN
jgi:hypothetical protein